jgi:hypothetical protein
MNTENPSLMNVVKGITGNYRIGMWIAELTIAG